jgi:hypothetical protein
MSFGVVFGHSWTRFCPRRQVLPVLPSLLYLCLGNKHRVRNGEVELLYR